MQNEISMNQYTAEMMGAALSLLNGGTFALNGAQVGQFQQLLGELEGFRQGLVSGRITIEADDALPE